MTLVLSSRSHVHESRTCLFRGPIERKRKYGRRGERSIAIKTIRRQKGGFFLFFLTLVQTQEGKKKKKKKSRTYFRSNVLPSSSCIWSNSFAISVKLASLRKNEL